MDRIGRYQILGELGRGAMGVVYRAQDPAIGRTVAIKTIRLGELSEPDERGKLRERLFREAQSAGMLSHPGIVTIYDIAEEGEMAYIAMECVDGPTLDRLVGADPPDGRLILSILTQTASALDYAHKRGIVHRDIKPANIIVHARAEAKITDFGVAKIQSHQMTQAGSMIGTPNYMSPEQIQGKAVDGRSDQYSLAVIAYELLTGEKPFSADSIAALAFKIVHDDARPVHQLNPSLGWTVDTVIRKGLAKNPTDRYPTCSDFAFALENACRACKDWKPLVGSTAQDMATVMDPPPRPAFVAAPPKPVPVTPKPPAAVLPERPASPPVALRFARWLALAVVGAGLISALLVAGLRLLEDQPAPIAQTTPEPAAPAPAPRPSAMGESTAQKLPGEVQPVQEDPEPAAEPAQEPQQPVQTPRPTAPPAASEPVQTRLVTNPPGAFLVVDGRSEFSCNSPCTMQLPPGRHTLAANKEGYRRTLKIFELPQDSENFLNLERTTGTLLVRSEPRGAAIVVDGQRIADRTPAMLTLPTGRHTLEIELAGHREHHEVTVRESVITNLAVDLRD